MKNRNSNKNDVLQDWDKLVDVSDETRLGHDKNEATPKMTKQEKKQSAKTQVAPFVKSDDGPGPYDHDDKVFLDVDRKDQEKSIDAFIPSGDAQRMKKSPKQEKMMNNLKKFKENDEKVDFYSMNDKI